MQFLEGTGRKGNLPGNLSELLDAFLLEKIPVGGGPRATTTKSMTT